jgi:hypothetical protein
MSDAIKPAMTAEQWAEPQTLKHISDLAYDNELHAVAALALLRQPFGFTWVDVDDELTVAERYESDAGYTNTAVVTLAMRLARRARDRADRIAALLPPRDQGAT